MPAFLLRPIGGVLADRFNRLFLMIIGNLGSAVGVYTIIIMMKYDINNLFLIYPGIILSSIFVAAQNPAYKACVTDFLPKEVFTKASGLMQLSNSAQFLISPLVAGFLMMVTHIGMVLIIDVLTFVLSAIMILIVSAFFRDSSKKNKQQDTNFFVEIKDGFRAITENKGVVILITLVALILFYIGLIQALLAPMVLSFTNAKALGILQSGCAIGMLASAIFVSIYTRKQKNINVLAISLLLMGLFFSFIGIKPQFFSILVPGFLFFITIPFVNSSIDVLIRQNIDNEKQGRAWSLISVITYSGSILAYSIAGFLADKVFNPLLMPDGLLASTVGEVIGVGKGRGISLIFFISGLFVMTLSIIIYRSNSIRSLELEESSEMDSTDKLYEEA